jgi:hypothetical protein
VRESIDALLSCCHPRDCPIGVPVAKLASVPGALMRSNQGTLANL